uniref:Uncharacterized protein n=1 Tax=Eutreptiella gymnastica TaxID=73025 RepID=A0A7S1HRM2_9EUGL|mmetsp:Transcript_100031/g.172610  ORF Transcript_100031/g.172610 Transcript_100031/m.172610 type:complete len:225 (+) Transcript_100031:482-1156(+)
MEGDLARLRYAQTRALALPSVGMAVTADLADLRPSTHGTVHPRRKKDVGTRLALSALRVVYKDGRVVPGGPSLVGGNLYPLDGYFEAQLVFQVMQAEDSRFRLKDSVFFRGTADCKGCCATAPFRFVVGHRTVPATQFRTLKDGLTVSVTSAAVAMTPSAIQFMWENVPECALYAHGSADQLPAAPFHYSFGPEGQSYQEAALGGRWARPLDPHVLDRPVGRGP